MHELFTGDAGQSLFDAAEQDELKDLATQLKGWEDDQAVTVVQAFLNARRSGRLPDAGAVVRWVSSHFNDADAVLECMSVDPPREISIGKLLSRAGSQKLVFLSTWRLTQRQVVLKRLRGPEEEAARVISRESQTHPLSLSHPNIIETFLLQNSGGEVFLVEEFLPVMLSDSHRAQGVEEGANLLFDIANAITYLHDTLELVHGDIKPDNVGKRRENYVLLDFGICRPKGQFSNASPTGSLRTRAPELLLDSAYLDPAKVDVWALCATVFSAFAGRFPLLDPDESPPRISEPDKREQFINVLAARARKEYSQRVDLQAVPEPLRELLDGGLQRDPKTRWTARELRETAERLLPAYLRTSPSSLGARFSPREEVGQYQREFGQHPERLAHMPLPTSQAFRARLTALADFPYLEVDQLQFVRQLLARLGEP
jgi:serine/threonine protein kinase